MRSRGLLAAGLAACAAALAACGDPDPPRTATIEGGQNNSAVLGGYGSGSADGALTDARGKAIPPPPVAAGTRAQAVRAADDTAVAVWVRDGQVVGATWTREAGWGPPQPLEQIYGRSSDPQLASNGLGSAMAVWRHTVGSIRSLRFSRFQPGTGWSQPDVMPGALPRPNGGGAGGGEDAIHLQMDEQGQVIAQWPSGFDPNQSQTARYVPGRGWTAATDEPLAAAPAASASTPVR